MEEVWRDIKQYEGLYQVSNLGRVKSLERIVTSRNQHKTFERTIKERILSPGIDSRGYHMVSLNQGGDSDSRLVHILVAEAFVPNPQNKYSVNHEDGNKLNNNVNNLTRATRSEQQLHAYKFGLISKKGSKNGRAKLSDGDVLSIVSLSTQGYSYKEISKKIKASKYQISNILTGKTWTHLTGISK